jgi:hypothetical protein
MKRHPSRPKPVLQSVKIPEHEQIDLKFIADATLGTLVTWLRILGYDTTYDQGTANRQFLRRAQKESRIVLTRKRDLVEKQFIGRLLVIEHDRVPQQISEVIEKFALKPAAGRIFSRCLRCNLTLEKVRKDDVEGLVPEYVYLNLTDFRQCSQCRRVYWAGTHKENACRFLRQHIPAHPL